MLKWSCILVVIVLIFSCKGNKIAKTEQPYSVSAADLSHILPTENIVFDYSVSWDKIYDKLINVKEKMITVKARLINNNNDTAYFLTWSCHGIVKDIVYDTSQLKLYAMECRSSMPVKLKIAPHARLDFDAKFAVKKRPDSIQLGYWFFRVDKNAEVRMRSKLKFPQFLKIRDMIAIAPVTRPVK